MALPTSIGLRHVLRGHDGAVEWCAVSPDGTWIASHNQDRWFVVPHDRGESATESEEGSLRVWDPRTGECRHSLGESTDVPCAVSPDGSWILSATEEGSLRLWDPPSGECLRTFVGQTSPVRGCVSPDGSWIVSYAETDHTLRMWEVSSGRSGRVIARFTSSYIRPRLCAVSPDGSWLVYGTAATTDLQVHDVAAGTELLHPGRPHQGGHGMFGEPRRRLVGLEQRRPHPASLGAGIGRVPPRPHRPHRLGVGMCDQS